MTNVLVCQFLSVNISQLSCVSCARWMSSRANREISFGDYKRVKIDGDVAAVSVTTVTLGTHSSSELVR
jgi:hypothetical protein